jgi:hypothetical protein
MHSVLFVATPIDRRGDWSEFLTRADMKVGREKGVYRLSENVWLVNMKTSPSVLGRLISLADAQTVPYGLLPFEHEPEWLPAGFDPTSIQVRTASR